MAPEVLSKNTPYDSSADWFSFGCVLYKLLIGRSPFRQQNTKDKHEIDRMTLTMVRVKIPSRPSCQIVTIRQKLKFTIFSYVEINYIFSYRLPLVFDGIDLRNMPNFFQ